MEINVFNKIKNLFFVNLCKKGLSSDTVVIIINYYYLLLNN